MIEAEWLSSTDPTPMLLLEFLRGQASERKMRLFACGCCRHVWHLLIDERSRVAVETAERLADCLLGDGESQAAFSAACAASLAVSRHPDEWPETVLRLWRQSDSDTLWRTAVMAAFAVGTGAGNIQAHLRGACANGVDQEVQCRLFRDIFGNPFRPIAIDPAWLSSTVVPLARQIYDSRDFSTMSILADALQDAGCDNAEMLDHCRNGSQHTRGCFVVDLLLGKS